MSSSDVSALKRSLSLFHHDERGCHVICSLFDVEMDIRVNTNSHHSRLVKAIKNLHHDLWQVSALVSRLVWTREMMREGQIEEQRWRISSQLDIENYYVQLRSLLDYLAIVIASSSESPGQMPSSFRRLRESAHKHVNRVHPDIASFIQAADWFDELRAIRDCLVHDGAEPMVFSDSDEFLLFQIHGPGMRNMISKGLLLHNENVAYFDRFVAWSLSHTLSALACVGTAIAPSFQYPISVGPTRSYSPGFHAIQAWMQELLERIEGQPNNSFKPTPLRGAA